LCAFSRTIGRIRAAATPLAATPRATATPRLAQPLVLCPVSGLVLDRRFTDFMVDVNCLLVCDWLIGEGDGVACWL
jgi:hypothetical protein